MTRTTVVARTAPPSLGSPGLPGLPATADPPLERAGAGAIGMEGGIRLRAEVVGGRTRITDLAWRPPLQVLRAHHVDGRHPDLASVTLASPAGGILQGDGLTIDIDVGPAARLRVGTQSATRVYRAPAAEASQVARLRVAAGGYLEYVPEPWIPYAGSRLRSQTRLVLDPAGTAIVVETIGPGRAARGEVLAFEHFESLTEIVRDDGMLVATDAVVLHGGRTALGRVGLLGEHLTLATVLVARTGFGPEVLRSAATSAAATAATATPGAPDIAFGASALPNSGGAWLRVLASDLRGVAAITAAAVAAARLELL